MVILMAIAFTLSMRWFRQSLITLPKPFDRFTIFNAFWYLHHLLVIVYILLVIHGTFLLFVHKWYSKTTWMYLAVPVLLYVGERTLRFFRSGLYTVRLLKVRQTLDKVILTLKDLNMGEYPGLNDHWMDVISSQGSSLLSLDWLGSDVTDPGLTYQDCKNMQALNLNYCDQIIDHRVENISGKYSFSSNVHWNRYGVIEAKEGVSNSLIMPAVITPGDTLDLSTVLFRSQIILIGTLINFAVA
ncbi:Respiratory burst oxidase -like protein A [Capsicum baccatum]|uniref:Respiratory burst oxidase-like protein A n=1 Tax=Capsicum baccatum TaxID=33114 RepID=A0A2G2UXE3_CAPBA|nr:Respiratory burst oxidase -like protein A [Capsicum baccatum]